MQNNRKRMGLLAILGCTMLICSVSGMGTNCKGIFYEPMALSMQLSMSKVTFVSTLYGITAALSVPICCSIYRKVPSKMFLPAMVFLFCLSGFMTGNARTITQVYIWGAIQGIPGGFIVFYPVQYIIGNWFPEKKGSVLGLVLMSTGVAGMIFNPVAAGWIEKFGWQWAHKAQAIIILAVALPAALFLLYKSPEEAGFAPTQTGAGSEGALQSGETQQRTSRFTVIKLFLMVIMICGSYGIVQHLPKYASDLGKTATFGALLVSMSMAGNLTGKALFGAANDKFGAKAMTIFSALCVCLGILVVIFCKVNALLMAGSFLMGIVLVMISLQVPLLFRDFCDPKTYEKVYPLTCSANVALCAVSQNFISVQYQQAGGYEKVFTFYGAAMIGLCLILLTIGRKKKI